MLSTKSLYALSIFLIPLAASAAVPQPNQNLTDGHEVTTEYFAILPLGHKGPINVTALEWKHTETARAICQPEQPCPCRVTVKETVRTLRTGDWWTSWCRVAGLTTNQRGDFISIEQSKMRSTSAYAKLQISVPMASSLSATIGWSVTDSKGWGRNMGCVNDDGWPHGLWLQEHMGWADQEITRTYYGSGECQWDEVPATTVEGAHIDYPDPFKTGFREFQNQCHWGTTEGIICQFENSKNIAGS